MVKRVFGLQSFHNQFCADGIDAVLHVKQRVTGLAIRSMTSGSWRLQDDPCTEQLGEIASEGLQTVNTPAQKTYCLVTI
jgi:hypothetical protein